MALITKQHTFSPGGTILSAEHNTNYDTIYDDYNGNITNANISASAAIADSKLAQVTTAGKVSGAALTSLSSIPSGAGDIPSANLDGNACVLTGAQTVAGVKTFSSIPVLPGSNPTADNEATRKLYVDQVVQFEDYGTSASSSTTRDLDALFTAGGRVSVSGSSSTALSNLPFTSSTSYVLIACFGSNQSATEAVEVVQSSGSAATIYNNDNQAQTVNWFAIGI